MGHCGNREDQWDCGMLLCCSCLTNEIFFKVKINHQSQSLSFGADVSLMEHDTLPEGPVIQVCLVPVTSLMDRMLGHALKSVQ